MSVKPYFRSIEVDFSEGQQLDLRARLAFDLIRTYGLIAAREDGEDGARRSKLKLQTVEEVVARSFALAETVIATCEERGYIREITLTRDQLDDMEEDRRDRHMNKIFARQEARKAASPPA